MLDDAIARCLALSQAARTQQGAALAATLAALDAALAEVAGARAAQAAGPAHAAGAGASAPASVPSDGGEAALELDLAGYITAWTAGAERLFGYTEQEAVGQNILFLYTEDDDGALAELLYEQDGGVCEVRRRRKSGEVIWVQLALSLLQDEMGEPQGMRVRMVHVSEPLSDFDKISLHARIIEDSEQGVLITDAKERIVSINSALRASPATRRANRWARRRTCCAPACTTPSSAPRCARPWPATARGAARSSAGARTASCSRSR